MTRALIEFRKVSKHSDGRQILQNFNLKIFEGEFVTIIGSSDFSKTSVLKMINGVQTPDSGAIRLDGEDISKVDPNKLRRQIGYVMQGVGLCPHINVKNNIAYILYLLGEEQAVVDDRINEICEMVAIDKEVLQRFPNELSNGQRQRVGIARALAAKQKILLMDEPFGAVDNTIRQELQTVIYNIHRATGLTILFITHDINEAFKLGNRVMIMNEGRIDQFAEPSFILTKPKTDYVKKLITV